MLEADSRAAESADVEVQEYLEGTYELLRHGAGNGAGLVIAELIDGAWELNDGRRFSDWAVALNEVD
ncbi:MAG: hypothetical protein ACYCZN_01725 [Candidatus Dormibacteria bacterium]